MSWASTTGWVPEGTYSGMKALRGDLEDLTGAFYREREGKGREGFRSVYLTGGEVSFLGIW